MLESNWLLTHVLIGNLYILNNKNLSDKILYKVHDSSIGRYFGEWLILSVMTNYFYWE
jgi:hypothetical protein